MTSLTPCGSALRWSRVSKGDPQYQQRHLLWTSKGFNRSDFSAVNAASPHFGQATRCCKKLTFVIEASDFFGFSDRTEVRANDHDSAQYVSNVAAKLDTAFVQEVADTGSLGVTFPPRGTLPSL
jgi:hypothetical protein